MEFFCTVAQQESLMFFYIFCGLLLLKVFAAEAATSPSNSTSLLDRIKKLLAAAKEKFSKMFSFESKTLPTECYDQAPEECYRLYEQGVCNHKDVAMEYCPITCGFCRSKNDGSRSGKYITSDEWDKIPNGHQAANRANP